MVHSFPIFMRASIESSLVLSSMHDLPHLDTLHDKRIQCTSNSCSCPSSHPHSHSHPRSSSGAHLNSRSFRMQTTSLPSAPVKEEQEQLGSPVECRSLKSSNKTNKSSQPLSQQHTSLMAIIESRGVANEIGYASMDLSTSECYMTQVRLLFHVHYSDPLHPLHPLTQISLSPSC